MGFFSGFASGFGENIKGAGAAYANAQWQSKRRAEDRAIKEEDEARKMELSLAKQGVDTKGLESLGANERIKEMTSRTATHYEPANVATREMYANRKAAETTAENLGYTSRNTGEEVIDPWTGEKVERVNTAAKEMQIDQRRKIELERAKQERIDFENSPEGRELQDRKDLAKAELLRLQTRGDLYNITPEYEYDGDGVIVIKDKKAFRTKLTRLENQSGDYNKDSIESSIEKIEIIERLIKEQPTGEVGTGVLQTMTQKRIVPNTALVNVKNRLQELLKRGANTKGYAQDLAKAMSDFAKVMDSPSDGIRTADYLGQLAPTYTQLVYNHMQANPQPTDAEVTPSGGEAEVNAEKNALQEAYKRATTTEEKAEIMKKFDELNNRSPNTQ